MFYSWIRMKFCYIEKDLIDSHIKYIWRQTELEVALLLPKLLCVSVMLNVETSNHPSSLFFSDEMINTYSLFYFMLNKLFHL